MKIPLVSCAMLAALASATLIFGAVGIDAATAVVNITPSEVDYGGPYYAGPSEYLDAAYVGFSPCQTYGKRTITTQNAQNWSVTAGDEEVVTGVIDGAEQPLWIIYAEGATKVYAWGSCDDAIEDEYWARARGWVAARGALSYEDGYEAKVANEESEEKYTWNTTVGGETVTFDGKIINEGGLTYWGPGGSEGKTLNQAAFQFTYASGTQIALYSSHDTDEVTGIVNEGNPAYGWGRNGGYAYAFDGKLLLGMWLLD